jgi:hypothetical protein
VPDKRVNVSTIVEIDDLEVLYVASTTGPDGAPDAFERLEARLPSLRGRRFYGVFDGNEYRACVAVSPGEAPAAWGLPRCVIPGGRYARVKLVGWRERVSEIREAFARLIAEHGDDETRPAIEFYRSSRELILLSPVPAAVGRSEGERS